MTRVRRKPALSKLARVTSRKQVVRRIRREEAKKFAEYLTSPGDSNVAGESSRKEG